MIKNLLLFTMIALIFTSCSSKNKEYEEYNKPAAYWYNKILKDISRNQLDDADDKFTSLESEYRNSPLISSAMMILVNAHIDEEEYEMANYYLDEYIKRYGFEKNIDYVRYLKIKSKFMSFKSQYREQQLIIDTLEETKEFLDSYPNSPYIYLVQTMQTRLFMAKASFDKEISELYLRTKKPKASKVYAQRSKKSFKYTQEIVKVRIPWYKAIFESEEIVFFDNNENSKKRKDHIDKKGIFARYLDKVNSLWN